MTWIIVTLGPSTITQESLIKLHELGVRILRLNFTHFTPATAIPVIEMINQINSTLTESFQLMMDIEWPSIRTGDIQKPRAYKKDQTFTISTVPVELATDIFCDYDWIIHDVKVGSIIRIESGLFDVVVLKKWWDSLKVKALNDFTLTSKRHINIPGIHINLPTITEKDKQDMWFAIEQKFSYIAVSFCRSADDIKEARMFLQEYKWPEIKLIAKIENQEWIDNLDEITEASDMVMVARGDLGTEIPLEDIPEIQMEIVKTCQLRNTPVIIATQMMSSMVDNPSPTRAEVSDVFLAVREGADYVMLSEETTIGHYPIETVEMMKRIVNESQH